MSTNLIRRTNPSPKTPSGGFCASTKEGSIKHRRKAHRRKNFSCFANRISIAIDLEKDFNNGREIELVVVVYSALKLPQQYSELIWIVTMLFNCDTIIRDILAFSNSFWNYCSVAYLNSNNSKTRLSVISLHLFEIILKLLPVRLLIKESQRSVCFKVAEHSFARAFAALARAQGFTF